jgi:hypothetical protein
MNANLGATVASKQTCHAEVFVDKRPMNSGAVTEKLVPLTFCATRVRQTREPSKGNGEHTTIGKRNDKLIVRYLYAKCAGATLKDRRIHPNLAETRLCAHPRFW